MGAGEMMALEGVFGLVAALPLALMGPVEWWALRRLAALLFGG